MRTASAAKSADIPQLIESLRSFQARLKEVLEELESGDMTPTQIRDHLDWVAEGLKHLRKAGERSKT